MTQENRPRVGIGVVVFDEERILVGKRKGAHGAGTWALPGGHLEYRERIEECAERELFEETGLTALHVEKGPWSNDLIDGKHYITLFALVREYEGEIQLKEPEKCHCWEWHSPLALPKPHFAPVETLLRYLARKKPQIEIAYLSCPYNHEDPQVKAERKRLATEAAAALFKQGIAVFSPLTHNHSIAEMTNIRGWEVWGAYDLSMVARCDRLYLLKLPGWEKSTGVQAELEYARKLGIPIEELTMEGACFLKKRD